MPGILRALIDFRNPFSILSKGTLMLRDLDLLVEAAQVTEVHTSFSIGTVDERVWRETEPGTPHPRKRLEAVAKLNQAGIPCGVLMAPIIPGISDNPDLMRRTAAAAIEAGATHVYPILLHLRPHVKEVFMSWLEREHPRLVPRYEELYRGRSYAPAATRRDFDRGVGAILRSLPPPEPGIPRWRKPDPAAAHHPAPARPAEQLDLIPASRR
jgi:DNA repair photolyase